MCLLEAGTQKCADDASIGGKLAKGSALRLFRTAYGDDLSEITQFAIDLALFGLAYQEELFEYSLPAFSREYSRTNRKARMTRVLL